MIFTAEERRALLALLALLLVGQVYSLWEASRRARPDRELSRWLEKVEQARGDSLVPAGAGLLPVSPLALPGRGPAADSTDSGPSSAAGSPAGKGGLRAMPAGALPPGILEGGRLCINRAGPRDLDALPGIGPGLAKRILEAREKSGPFRRPEDLLRVPGIGPKKLAALREKIDCSVGAGPPAGPGR